MRVAIGSDHAGFELKEAVRAFLSEQHQDVIDVGAYNGDPVDYPDCAEAVGAALRDDRAERGIILCGSGVGVSIAGLVNRAAMHYRMLLGRSALAGRFVVDVSRRYLLGR